MTTSEYTVFNALTDIVTAPGTALAGVKDHVKWLWWPLGLSMLLGIGLTAYYINWVDFDWMVDELIMSQPAETRAQSAEFIRDRMSRQNNLVMSAILIPVVSLLIYSLLATYYHLANKLTAGVALRWTQWFSMSVWTGFVNIFSTLAAFVVIFMQDGNQLPQHELQALSVNSLLLHLEPGDRGFTWGNSLLLTNFWSVGLVGIGFSRWTGSGVLKSIIIGAFPLVLVYGIWAAFI